MQIHANSFVVVDSCILIPDTPRAGIECLALAASERQNERQTRGKREANEKHWRGCFVPVGSRDPLTLIVFRRTRNALVEGIRGRISIYLALQRDDIPTWPSVTSPINASTEIEVFELDEYVSSDQKELVHNGSIVVVRKTLQEGKDAYSVYVIEGKKVGSQVGTLDPKLVVGNDLVAGNAYVVTNDLRNSEKLTDKRKSVKHRA
ncbi:hypothetical protein BASA84_001726 [Batrachochytrium salamandrivorans]|nr:hypothetical protein BASA84_001726 [Batrachochytrium salamandrivorans]